MCCIRSKKKTNEPVRKKNKHLGENARVVIDGNTLAYAIRLHLGGHPLLTPLCQNVLCIWVCPEIRYALIHRVWLLLSSKVPCQKFLPHGFMNDSQFMDVFPCKKVPYFQTHPFKHGCFQLVVWKGHTFVPKQDPLTRCLPCLPDWSEVQIWVCRLKEASKKSYIYRIYPTHTDVYSI